MAAITIFGLALGIAAFLTLATVTRYEFSFDKWIPDSEQVYRLDEILRVAGGSPVEVDSAAFPAADALEGDYRDSLQLTRIDNVPVGLRKGSKSGSNAADLVDPDFFAVLPIPLIAGDAKSALDQPDSVVLSSELARQYFGTDRALGQQITITRAGVQRNYTVSGVLAPQPSNSTYDFSILIPFDQNFRMQDPSFRHWYILGGTVLIRFPNQASVTRIDKNLDAMERRHVSGGEFSENDPTKRVRLKLVPLNLVHFFDHTIDASDAKSADERVVICLVVVGFLSLLAATVNYVNLAVAQALLRAREVAVQKALGATRWHLIGQMLAEVFFTTLIAALVGTAITELLLPVISSLYGAPLFIDYTRSFFYLTGVVLGITIGAGSYPAWLFASWRASAILGAGHRPSLGRFGSFVRASLVCAQFFFAICIAICTLVIDRQASYLRSADRGFRSVDSMIIANLSEPSVLPEQRLLLDGFRHLPGISGVTDSDYMPGGSPGLLAYVWADGHGKDSRRLTTIERVGDNYFSTLDIHIISGRGFDDSHGQDDAQGEFSANRIYNVVLDERAVQQFGLGGSQSAVGRIIRTTFHGTNVVATVIGVAAEARFGSGRAAANPVVYLYDRKPIPDGSGFVRFTSPQGLVTSELEAEWRRLAPTVAFNATRTDLLLSSLVRPEEQRGRLFMVGAFVSLMISCLGLYALSTFNAARRLHEIGIRKTLGASKAQVLWLLIMQLLRPIVIANVVAWPVAWLIMRGWLDGFDQRVELSPFYFASVTVVAISLCLATVFMQTYSLASAEPSRALRRD